MQSESESPGDSDALVEVAAEHKSVKNIIKTHPVPQSSDPGLSDTDFLRTSLKQSVYPT